MAVILGIGAAILSVVTSVVSVVSTVLFAVGTAIYTALTTVVGTLWSVTGGVVLGVTEGLGLIGTTTATNIMSSLHMVNVIGTLTFTSVSTLVGTLTTGFKTFLEIIHFDTLLKINDIAYLVSSSYREMMSKVYGQLAKFSNAVGLGAQFITLAIRNARSVVLDVSTMLGRGYDLSEVTWLTEMNTFFSKINEKSKQIEKDPYLLLHMLDESIFKPSLDMKGSVVQGIFSTIDTTLDALNGVVEKVDGVRDDLQQFYNDLPEAIQKEVKPFFDTVLDPVNDFIANVYTPAFKDVQTALNIIDAKSDVNNEEVNAVIDRLKKPGDVLQGVYGLPAEEQTEQQQKMYEVVNAPMSEAGNVASAYNENEGLLLLEEAEKALSEMTKPAYEVPEAPPIDETPLGEQDKSKTWYVGDY